MKLQKLDAQPSNFGDTPMNPQLWKNHPLVMSNMAIENGPVEIVDFPIINGGSFHSYVNVYQRVYVYIYIYMEKSQFSHGFPMFFPWFTMLGNPMFLGEFYARRLEP